MNGGGAMPKKRPTATRRALLGRQIQVQSAAVHVSRRADKPRGSPPIFEGGPWLEVRGIAEEPARDVRDVVINVHVDDREEPGASNPPSVGAIVQLRPCIQAVIGLASADFDRVWSLATSGRLRYCWIAFTEPYRQSALVVSVSFSNEFEE